MSSSWATIAAMMMRDWRSVVVAGLALICTGCEQQVLTQPVAAGTQCRQVAIPLTMDPVIAPNYAVQCLMPGSNWERVIANRGAERQLIAPLGTIYPAPADAYLRTGQTAPVWPSIFGRGG